MYGKNCGITNTLNSLWSQYRIVRVGSRVVVATLLLKFCLLAIESYLLTRQINYLLLIVAEFFTVILVVFSRDTKQINLSPLAIIATVGGTFYYIFFDFFNYPAIQIINKQHGAFLQCIGIVLQIFSKASLGLSFGLAPANRGVKRSGAYRVVRHPIYASYLIAQLGFILSFFNFFNLAVLLFSWICQIIRIFEEERVLRHDENYVSYTKRVRWRLIPTVF